MFTTEDRIHLRAVENHCLIIVSASNLQLSLRERMTCIIYEERKDMAVPVPLAKVFISRFVCEYTLTETKLSPVALEPFCFQILSSPYLNWNGKISTETLVTST